MKNEDLTEKIIGCAFKVHNALGPGFLEKVYENGPHKFYPVNLVNPVNRRLLSMDEKSDPQT